MTVNAEDLNQTIVGYRTFLHDMANKLVIAQGMASAVQMGLESSGGDAKMLERLKKSVKAMDDMTDLIKSQREQLIELQKKIGITN